MRRSRLKFVAKSPNASQVSQERILLRPQGLAHVSREKRSQGQADGQAAAAVDGADSAGDADLPRHMDPERAALRGGDHG